MRLIDADALKEFIGTYDGTTAQVEAVEVQYIDKAPTIDDLSEYSDKLWKKAYERGKAEARPQGEWSDESKDSLLCSACGKRVYKPFIGGFPTERTSHYYPNFCAFCGADMRGGRE